MASDMAIVDRLLRAGVTAGGEYLKHAHRTGEDHARAEVRGIANALLDVVNERLDGFTADSRPEIAQLRREINQL